MKFQLDDIIIYKDVDGSFRREKILGYIGDKYVLEILEDEHSHHISKIIHIEKWVVEKISKLDINYMKKRQFDKEMAEIIGEP